MQNKYEREQRRDHKTVHLTLDPSGKSRDNYADQAGQRPRCTSI